MAEDLHRHATEQIARYGMLTKAPNTGVPMQSPYLPIVNKQAQIMLKAGAELGFTPTSRSRIHAPQQPDKENPFMRHGRRPAEMA